ncbi:MAG TPA: DUF389 domain-containing protein [Lentimicrobium sp.]|nr:DUF389 domain-containing protein [Lentimicrobium sp.]
MSRIKELLHYLNLDGEVEDFDRIHQTIEKDLVFKGTNLWILVFAIIIASVGLNINSTAVIIGAMLISPLMGPINGIGYSIATYNFPLLRTALKNFGFAVAASLVASTSYFALSPVATAHSELLARTSPTIYDVLIAFFGGLSGIVAISSKQKGNVIPGVAIATALMPPLCTAGYGLASAQFQFFFGALYLFTINTVFIALSAIVVSQLLNFPISAFVQESHKKSVNRWISLVTAVTIIPSIYFGYGLVKKEQFNENVARYTNNISVFEGSYLLKYETDPANRLIKLIYGGNELSETDKQSLQEKAKDFSLEDASLEIKQGFSLSETNNNEIDNLKLEIGRLNNELATQVKLQDSLTQRQLTGKAILNELNAIYPSIIACSYADTYQFSLTGQAKTEVAQVIFTLQENNLNPEDKNRIYKWLQKRLGNEQLVVHYIAGSQD